MQVHAISSKASDVRAVVMDLNAKRQAAEEQGDANDHSSPPRTDEKHAKKEAVSAVAWQDYNEDVKAQERPACADAPSKEKYTTVAPERFPKRRRREEPGLVSRHIVRGPRGYRNETLRYDDGSVDCHITQPPLNVINLGCDSPQRTQVPRKTSCAAPKRPRRPLLPTQPHKAVDTVRDKSGPEGHELQTSAAGQPAAKSAWLPQQNAPAEAKRSSGSSGISKQPDDSRPDVRQAPNKVFDSSAALQAAGDVCIAVCMSALAAAPAQTAQPTSGQEAEPDADADALLARHGLRERTGAEGSMWQAFMDELQCDATPGKQQQRSHSLWQATGACAAELNEASFVTSYD
ncbi:g2882 [Coccomyxa viridis]|uniref:G2882 protein n=1 Tax=Coccomyxa viridis TaxID=1274662 RepID=A0ABP1FPG1_9CHLO